MTEDQIVEARAKAMQGASPSLFRLEMGENFDSALRGEAPVPWDDLAVEDRASYLVMARATLHADTALGLKSLERQTRFPLAIDPAIDEALRRLANALWDAAPQWPGAKP